MNRLNVDSIGQNVIQRDSACDLTALLFVDDHPCTLADILFQRRDVQPILLRFQQVLNDLLYCHTNSR